MLDKNLQAQTDKNFYTCKNITCNNHQLDIIDLYNTVVNACIKSAETVIPQSGTTPSKSCKKNKCIPGWKESVELSRQRALLWHGIWKDLGSPRDGTVAEIRRSARAQYHRDIRRLKADEERIRNLERCKKS